jgi:hypothetical protein
LAYKIQTPGNYPEEGMQQTTKSVGPTPCHLTPSYVFIVFIATLMTLAMSMVPYGIE